MDITAAYAELGLAPGASEREVKAAWRRLASEWHPDRNPSENAVRRMQRINQAVECLRDAGFDEAEVPPPRPAARREAPEPAPEPAPPSELARQLARKLKLSLEEAALGCTRSISGKLREPCPVCAGRGHAAQDHDCPDCEGSGRLRPRGWAGLFTAPGPCEPCGGTGRARTPCAACGGSGQQAPQLWEMTVRIPPGVREGDVLGVDRPARAGLPPLHLELRISLQPHPLFTLAPDGTLHGQVPVDGFSWIAGRLVDVPTLDGLHPLPLRQAQRVYRLPGRGFPVTRRGARGDAVVEIVPLFPEQFSPQQQGLLDQLIASLHSGEAGAADPRLADWQDQLRRWQKSRR